MSFDVYPHAQDQMGELISQISDSVLEFYGNMSNATVVGWKKTDLAPIIILSEPPFSMQLAAYSFCPKWAKEYPVKWSSYNARLERVNQKTHKAEKIYQVATWKEAFRNSQFCAVPMSSAHESCHFGRNAGEIVKFFPKSQPAFYALGIWEIWLNQLTQQPVRTFALLTDGPYPYWFQTGHDRGLVVIDEKKLETTVLQIKKSQAQSQEDLLDYIREIRIDLPWKHQSIRKLKKIHSPSQSELREIETTIFKGSTRGGAKSNS